MRDTPLVGVSWWLAYFGLFLGETVVYTGAAEPMPPQPAKVLTNVAQLRHRADAGLHSILPVRLEGVVCAVSSAPRELVLQDATGAERVELEFQGQPVQPGTRVIVEGDCMAKRWGRGVRFGIARAPVVDNDGAHAMAEASGAVLLKAGRQPIRIVWFNGVGGYGLEVQYQGPDLPRRGIPDAALFREVADPATGGTRWVNGLEYRYFEGGVWDRLPDFDQLTAVGTGTVSNVDLGFKTMADYVGVQFAGFLAVPRDGRYTFHLKSNDGSQLFVGESSLRLTVLGQGPSPVPRRVTIGQVLSGKEDSQWSEVEGTVTFASEQSGSWELELSSKTARMRVEVAAAGSAPQRLLHSQIRAVGVCLGTDTADGQKRAGMLWVPSWKEVEVLSVAPRQRDSEPVTPAAERIKPLPLLTSIAQIRGLKPEEARRGYPVKVRGVLTFSGAGDVIHDSTWGIYVNVTPSQNALLQFGDYCEIEGATGPGEFAPSIQARRVNRLGLGQLPEPVHPTWDQLMNGSLDCQYVELQGIVVGVHSAGATLRIRGSGLNVKVHSDSMSAEELRRLKHAFVRVRGCLLALYDDQTLQVKSGEIRIRSAAISVVQSAPADPFAIPAKRVSELLRFDPQADALQRVKVAGQVIHEHGGEFFLMDGTNGLRFIPDETVRLSVGDLVEVAGFLELGGPSPVLREALVRPTGRAALPGAKKLSAPTLFSAAHDATLVQVESRLVGLSTNHTGHVLELQTGPRLYRARLNTDQRLVRSVTVGSRLALTGVYAAQGSNRAENRDINWFDLLLNSPADVTVLEQPSWWTPRRAFTLVGTLAAVLLMAVGWITVLRHQVEKRTRTLEQQIQERERAEIQRAMAQERTRVAQDLHDDLGSGLTEISMLGERAQSPSIPTEQRHRYLDQMCATARQLVTALDEIVWAMNPKHNALESLVSYLCLHADRFLGLAKIPWRLEGADGLRNLPVDSRPRHELFLAFKEILANIVHHSGATEVRLGLRLEAGQLRLSVRDNGRGFNPAVPGGGNGLGNLRKRLTGLGGRCEIDSSPAAGTTVSLSLPLPETAGDGKPDGNGGTNDS